MSERPKLQAWADGEGPEGIEQYWLEKNVVTIDGKQTGIEERIN